MEKQSNSINFKNAICYIPLVGLILFFIEKNKSASLIKHIKYGTALFFIYLLIRFIITGLLMLPIGGFLGLIYIFIISFFGYKAYSGENINIEYIDDFEKKIKENLDNKPKL